MGPCRRGQSTANTVELLLADARKAHAAPSVSVPELRLNQTRGGAVHPPEETRGAHLNPNRAGDTRGAAVHAADAPAATKRAAAAESAAAASKAALAALKIDQGLE
eukprot:scaffold21820_cov39-Phaeocystis_antarctica.AAC.1